MKMILKIHSSIGQNFWKSSDFDDFFEFFFEICKKYQDLRKNKKRKMRGVLLYELFERKPGWRFTARCHTKTLGKRKSRRPRTQVLLTMKNMFSNVIALLTCLLISIIPLKKVLKFIYMVVKDENDFGIS